MIVITRAHSNTEREGNRRAVRFREMRRDYSFATKKEREWKVVLKVRLGKLIGVSRFL
mgnify:CR=1 FL=1|jgi:hypothetical protein